MAMRILILSWEYPPNVVGGMGRHVAELLPELARQGITHLFINLPELKRLRNSYDYQYVFNGQPRKGTWNLDRAAWREMARFIERFCRPVYKSGVPFKDVGMVYAAFDEDTASRCREPSFDPELEAPFTLRRRGWTWPDSYQIYRLKAVD